MQHFWHLIMKTFLPPSPDNLHKTFLELNSIGSLSVLLIHKYDVFSIPHSIIWKQFSTSKEIMATQSWSCPLPWNLGKYVVKREKDVPEIGDDEKRMKYWNQLHRAHYFSYGKSIKNVKNLHVLWSYSVKDKSGFSCSRFTVIPRLVMAISTKHLKNRCLKRRHLLGIKSNDLILGDLAVWLKVMGGSVLQRWQGGTRPAWQQGCGWVWRGWRAGGPVLPSATWPQRGRVGLCSCSLPLQLPCGGLEQPWLQRERMNAFFSLCQAGVHQGCRHCHDSCTFLVLNIVFSTSHCAPSCGEGRWEEQPAPPSLPVLGSMRQTGTPVAWGRAGFPGHGTGWHPGDMGQAGAPVDRTGWVMEY